MNIAVVGSINTDLVYEVEETPSKGETVFGNEYQLLNGGKGANQCVILSALERDVKFLGAVGSDVFGKKSLEHLQSIGLDKNVLTKDANTGLAVIQLSHNDNSITVIKGANDLISRDDVDQFFESNPSIDLLVSQLEICFDTIQYMIQKAKTMGIRIILNPAPAQVIEEDLIAFVDYLIPNEIEARIIFDTDDLEGIVKRYKGKVLITLGEQGVMYFDDGDVIVEPSLQFKVVDTTGAGDSFIAGFTSGIANSLSIRESIQKGIKIASITCQHLGAQSSYALIKDKE